MSALAQLVRGADNSWRVEGELVYATVPEVLEQGRRALAPGGAAVIDLAGVTRVDSAALALLLEWMALCRARGGTIRFLHVPRELVAIAGLSNVEGLLPLADG